jgi:outer membrane protein TolC
MQNNHVCWNNLIDCDCPMTTFLALLFISLATMAEEKGQVLHLDPIEINQNLTLGQLVDLTLEKYPEQALNKALISEAEALQQRSNHWLSAAPRLSFRYQDDKIADNKGQREIEPELEFSLWHWGQRTAGQKWASQANLSVGKQQTALRLHVSALVRHVLWDMALEEIHYEQAYTVLEVSAQLLAKIKRRVELGDLPQFDLLLAQSDHLEKQALLVQAKAQMMYARERYYNLTQTIQVPLNYTETQSERDSIDDHPALQALNALIDRETSHLNWVKSSGSGSPTITLAGKRERDSRFDNDIESISVAVSIPFGGAAHLAPEIAAANIELTKIKVQHQQLYRKLTGDLHEIKHQLEINHAELELAIELKKIAEQHLKMAQFGFSEGEINLMDLLKVQAKTHSAVHHLKEHEVMLLRNIAWYNQVVGVQP